MGRKHQELQAATARQEGGWGLDGSREGDLGGPSWRSLACAKSQSRMRASTGTGGFPAVGTFRGQESCLCLSALTSLLSTVQ